MKCMACDVLDGQFVPFQAFQQAKRSFYFTKVGDTEACYVTPYVIVIDGKDIMCRIIEGKCKVEIGWKFPIYHNKGDFDTLVEEQVLDRFRSLWSDIRVQTKKPESIKYDFKNELVVKPGVKYRSLDTDELIIYPTHRGSYSLNKKRFHPIYFVVMPGNRTTNFIPLNNANADNLCCINIRTLSFESSGISLTYNSKKVMEMITSGEIVLPTISDD